MSDYRIVRVNNNGELEQVPVEGVEVFWENIYTRLRAAFEDLYDQIAKNDFTDSHGHKAQKMDAFTKAGKVLGK